MELGTWALELHRLALIDRQEALIRIEGEVQGCGFRDFAVREGNARKLKGWVRNRADGSVEPLAGADVAQMAAGDAILIETPGGGGYGPPVESD